VYQQRKTEIRQGKFVPQDIRKKHQNVLFKELVEDRIPEARLLRSSRNEIHRLEYWKNRFGNQPAESITPEDIEKANLELFEGRDRIGGEQTPAGANRYLATIKRVFSYAVKTTTKMRENPAAHVKCLKENNDRVRWLSEDEEKRLFEVLPKQYHAMVIIALNSGLRKSEQLNLRWTDVDLRLGQIIVRAGKNGKNRIIPINRTLKQALEPNSIESRQN
jgi:site-specific recombinase XerD